MIVNTLVDVSWCCQLKPGSVTYLLSVSSCQALSAPVLRLLLPLLKASFDGLWLCNLGSGCCEKSTGKLCWKPPWFGFGVAYLCWAIYLAGHGLDLLTGLPCLNPDLLHRYGAGWQPLQCSWPWLLSWPAVLPLLRHCGVVPHGSKDAARAYLVTPNSWLAPQSCCFLTLMVFLNSLSLWQLWGILWWELTSGYFLVFLRHWKWFRDALFYVSQEWVS